MTGNDALAGIRILDFTAMLAGPYCTRLAADLGAEVVKIEPPVGEFMRSIPPAREGVSTYFGAVNAGKKSVVLNLKTEAGRATARALIAKADAVVENMSPGAMARLGLDYASVRAIKPDIVYVSISGYGQDGPGADRPAYAPIIHASVGHDLASLAHQSGLTKPQNTVIFTADILGGTHAFAGLAAALLHRQRTGRGQHVDVALHDSMLNLLIWEIQNEQFPLDRPRVQYGPIQARDGFVMVNPISHANFEGLARTIGKPEWLNDSRFADGNMRGRHWPDMVVEIETWTATRSVDECESLLNAASCPCAAYRTVRQAMNHPQTLHRGAVATVSDAKGPFKIAASPYLMSATPPVAGPRVPSCGEHTEAVLGAWLDTQSRT
ncbi:MAG: CoA transferase [Alphaproteobacteria bacterium]|nr:CoA transferase [Alphaproteobacteria bacterium]